MRFPSIALTSLLVAGLTLIPAPGAAQTVQDLLASVERGGGWVSVPIRSGTGHVSTVTVPTVGVTVAGCVHVWRGHSGRWDIDARDALGPGRLEVSADAGESVPFTYTAGMRSKLEIDFKWSEPRDTTLYLWVGLARPKQDPEETCEPDRQAGGG
ncbi:MAG: hypothetical protein U5R14_02325 [Gemmatimonadota bacterium]|nr:hypothetical protein [Gemmatimonadota bacterium]